MNTRMNSMHCTLSPPLALSLCLAVWMREAVAQALASAHTHTHTHTHTHSHMAHPLTHGTQTQYTQTYITHTHTPTHTWHTDTVHKNIHDSHTHLHSHMSHPLTHVTQTQYTQTYRKRDKLANITKTEVYKYRCKDTSRYTNTQNSTVTHLTSTHNPSIIHGSDSVIYHSSSLSLSLSLSVSSLS